MAITDVRVLRRFQITEQKAQKGTIQYTASTELLVVCDSTPNFSEISNNTQSWPKIPGPIPQINDRATYNGYQLLVTKRDLEYLDEENEFIVKMTIGYDAKADEETNEDGEPKNTDAETWHRVSMSTQSATVPLTDEGEDGDKGGVPALNSAKDPVDGLQEDRALVKYTYTNTKVVNPNFPKLLEYTNRTNRQPFMGAAVRTLRCMGFSGEWDDKNQFWTVSVEFLYDPETWAVKYYDVGFNEIVDGERRAILDIQGNPVSKPVALDGNGQAVPIAQLDSQGGGPAVLAVYPYKQSDFANIFQECGI